MDIFDINGTKNYIACDENIGFYPIKIKIEKHKLFMNFEGFCKCPRRGDYTSSPSVIVTLYPPSPIPHLVSLHLGNINLKFPMFLITWEKILTPGCCHIRKSWISSLISVYFFYGNKQSLHEKTVVRDDKNENKK